MVFCPHNSGLCGLEALVPWGRMFSLEFLASHIKLQAMTILALFRLVGKETHKQGEEEVTILSGDNLLWPSRGGRIDFSQWGREYVWPLGDPFGCLLVLSHPILSSNHSLRRSWWPGDQPLGMRVCANPEGKLLDQQRWWLSVRSLEWVSKEEMEW